MASIISILAGLGLFFFGLETLSENLKRIAGRRFRRVLALSDRNRWLGALYGALAGAFLPSGAIVTFLLVSLLRTGALSVPGALPIIVGNNLGQSLFVLVAAVDMQVVALLAMGLTGLLRLNDRLIHFRPLLSAIFGLALLFFGLTLVKAGASSLTDAPWVSQLMQQSMQSSALSLVAGLGLRLLVQSSSAVSMLTVTLAGAGIVPLEQAVVTVGGANLGGGLATMLLTSQLRGRERQLAMGQAAFNVTGSLILIVLFFIEQATGIPLLIALLSQVGTGTEYQVALAFVLFKFVPAALLLPCRDIAVGVLERVAPPSGIEEDFKPKYLHDHALEEAESALDLVTLEQARLLSLLPRFLDEARSEDSGGQRTARLEKLAGSYEGLVATIDHFVDDLGRTGLSAEAYERLHGAITFQNLGRGLGRTLEEFVQNVHAQPRGSAMADLGGLIVEALDTVILTVSDALESGDPDDWALARAVAGDRHETLRQLRESFLADHPETDAREPVTLLQLTSLYQRALWLLDQVLTERERTREADA